jgi:SWI/SNF-related matrix-associated actin-dependent regulator 1 of chromatin subfamily A
MGLGKTIQAIAAMSVYRHEWPILVLSPSSARYHWSTEFKNWLGVDSEINKPTTKDGEDNINGDAGGSFDEASTDEDLLEESQIHVLTSSKDDILPNPSTKVVICSYGLAPMLIQSGAITPGMFRCAIVDESHMLKNKKTKRTALLMPILNAAGRCVLLSGTPALSRPSELYPQLVILGTERHGWWEDEADFMDKYVKGATARRRAELHTMLTGTVMIRRLKVDILKTLPHKLREKAALHVLNEDQRCVFKKLLMQLRESKGALGKIARKQYADRTSSETGEADALGEQPNEKLEAASAPAPQFAGSPGEALAAASLVLQKDYEKRLNEGKAQCSEVVTSSASHLGLTEQQQILHQLEGKLIADLDDEFKQKMEQIRDWFPTVNNGPPAPPPAEHDRTTVLNRLYSLTGDAKVPVIVDMLKRWLRDPTKGKICIFAHHISVLDSISVLAELSNSEDSNTKYIRIDGSTLPKKRQEQINDFQTDPSIRVAILGITAAGVAVTLTASSTVWFAELFWTPAIMIQAEDRCHRIGQQARVRCLYFVAKGTLDDVLFRLLEKKLQDIGEFVEGKEKLKYVINKTYDTTKELHKMFDVGEDSDSEEDGGMDDIDFDKELPLDEELEHDIEQLGEEEERMLQQADKYDDDPEASGAATGSDSDDRKMPAVEIPEEAELGRTEEEAITLLESDDEEEKESPSADAAASATFKENGGATAAAAATEEGGSELAVAPAKRAFDLQGPLHQCRLYRIHITGPTLGISVAFFQNRVVVERLTQDRIERFGEHSKPLVGDVLVGINGQRLPMINSLGQVLQHLRHVLMRPPVELTFAEDPDFVEHYKNVMRFHPAKQNRLHAATPAAPPRPPPVVDDNGVIDLIDDD